MKQDDSTISQMALSSGSYTPTLTNTTNVSSSTFTLAYWTQIGNIVTVTFSAAITPTVTTTPTTLTATLPVNTATTSQPGVGGGVLALNAGGLGYIGCYASVVSASTFQVYSTPTTTASSNISITIQYKIN
jgi:hypothetical protein